MASASNKQPVIGRAGQRAQAMAERLSARLMLPYSLRALTVRDQAEPEAMPSFRSLVFVWMARMVQGPALDGNELDHVKPGREQENRSSFLDSSERKWLKGPEEKERSPGSGAEISSVGLSRSLPLAEIVKSVLPSQRGQGKVWEDQSNQYRFNSPPLSFLRRLLRQPLAGKDSLLESVNNLPVSTFLRPENAMDVKGSNPQLDLFPAPVPPAIFFQTIAEGSRAVSAGRTGKPSLAGILLRKMAQFSVIDLSSAKPFPEREGLPEQHRRGGRVLKSTVLRAKLPVAASYPPGLDLSIPVQSATRAFKPISDGVQISDGLSGHPLPADNDSRYSSGDGLSAAWDKSHAQLLMPVRHLRDGWHDGETFSGWSDHDGMAASISPVNTVNLSSAKPSPKGEGWVRGNHYKEKSQFKSLQLSPFEVARGNLLPEGEAYPDHLRKEGRVLNSTGLTSPMADILTVAPIAADRLRGPLQELGTAAREARIHRDGSADRMARRLKADAVTIGTDIFFRYGRFEPESAKGFALLSHELTHVMQHLQGEIPDYTGGYAFRESLEQQAGSLEQTAFREQNIDAVEADRQQQNAFIESPALDMHLSPVTPLSRGQAGRPVASQQGAVLPSAPLRAAEDRDMPPSSAVSAPDTAALAAQVFRLMERRLQIDKERLGIRRR